MDFWSKSIQISPNIQRKDIIQKDDMVPENAIFWGRSVDNSEIILKFAKICKTMASDLQLQLDKVRAKALVLVDKYTRLREAFEASRSEIANLKAQVMSRDAEIEQLRLKVEYLSVASAVKLSGDDLAATRAMVADLVRDIDRCIEDLLE